jgi:L-ribulose-5-phosphate 3-epimerase UlaE
MDGWSSVEELTRFGFGQAQVVMANEAHNRLERCIRTRDVGVRMIRAAHEAG